MEKESAFDKLGESYFQKANGFSYGMGSPVKELYTPEDVKDVGYADDLGNPGEYPFTRGIHPDMYRGRLWTMREMAGFGTAEDTRERMREMAEQGTTGLSFIVDVPTSVGIDADHPLADGEVGVEGVPLHSLKL